MDHENLYLSSGNYETRSSKFTDENAKYRVEFERSYKFTARSDRAEKRLRMSLIRAGKPGNI